MKWISVKDQMPSDEHKLIIVRIASDRCGHYRCSFPHILIRDHIISCHCGESAHCPNREAYWTYLRDDGGYHYTSGEDVEFTHWIEIPELPKDTDGPKI